jgi:two-component system, chemotaxis family, CheB/CheR fusion protein
VPIETVARILHIGDMAAMAERVSRSGQVEEREVEHPNGGRWLLLRCAPFRNEIGRTQGVVLVLVDLTERHLSEQRLLAQSAVTQSMLDALQAQVLILDREGRVVHKNWGEFTPTHDESQLWNVGIGANYFEICQRPEAGPEAATWVEGMRKVLRGELPHFLHDYASDRPGDKRRFRVHVVPMRSPEPGLAVAHFNLTPVRPAENALAQRLLQPRLAP